MAAGLATSIAKEVYFHLPRRLNDVPRPSSSFSAQVGQMLIQLLFYEVLLYGATCTVSLSAPCPEDKATVCPNKLTDYNCEYFFEPSKKLSGNWFVDENCTKTEYRELALYCRRTCRSCCQDIAYQCENRRGTRLNCTAIAEAGGCSTEMPWIVLVLEKECPQACGMCINGDCVDKDPTCPFLDNFCEHKDWYQFMEETCPRTCNTCDKIVPLSTTSALSAASIKDECNDIATNCVENRNFCSIPAFMETMREQCRKTCNFCDEETNTINKMECVDTISTCPLWASSGYCTDPGYTTQQKQQYCRKSCGFC